MVDDSSKAAPSRPRKRPCATCPYRRNVASGIWATEEYEKLREYDGETFEQPMGAFMCHQGDVTGDVCSGWLGHGDPGELLAVRLGILAGKLDPSCMDYTTDVPLFASGAEAADHGEQDVESPSDEAVEAIEKIAKKRGLTPGE